MMKFNHFRYSKQWIAVFLSIFFSASAIAQSDVTCPVVTDLGIFDCSTIDNVPAPPNNIEEAAAAPYNLVVTNTTASTRVDSDDSGSIFYCTTDARSITRTVRVYEDTNFDFSYTEGEPSTTCTYTISTTEDTTPPVFTAPPSIELSCDVDISDESVTGLIVTIDDENCPVNDISDYTFYADAITENSPCSGSSVIVRSWTAVDPCGNTSEPQTQTITLTDAVGPEFTVPDDVTLDCGADVTDLTLTGDVTDESDNCDGSSNLDAQFADAETTTETVDCTEITTILRKWGLVDACQNPTVKDQIITIRCETTPTCNTDPCLGDLEILAADGCSCEVVEPQVLGCDDPAAQNYDAEANCNNADFCNFALAGCADSCAPNYNPDATEDDGTCEVYTMECNTDCTSGDLEVWDAASCSCVTDVVTIPGCTDPNACNYSLGANCDDGSCTAPEVCNDDICLGDITDSVGSDPCGCYLVEAQVLGCADVTAQNYNPDANCDDGSCIYGSNCSFTQGFWGNTGGKQDGLTTTEMIDAALASAGGSITVGAEGQSLTVSSAKCVTSLLPSTSGPRALKAGDEVYEGNCPQNKKNRIRNRLAAETLVLSLNTLTSPGLNAVVLCDPANCLVDRVPDSVCEILGDGGTIADLLVLANEVLGGVYEVTNRNLYSDVNEAINVISERYNECENPCSGGGERLIAYESMFEYVEIGPNPVTQNLNLQFKISKSADKIQLGVYQLNGQKVLEENMDAGKSVKNISLALGQIPSGIYIVSINVDGEIFMEKFVKDNQ